MSNIKWEHSTEFGWEIRFKCPECGSYFFGTDNEDGDEQGQCHGSIFKFKENGLTMQSCTFTWKRIEDYKVFIQEKKILPKGSMHYGR